MTEENYSVTVTKNGRVIKKSIEINTFRGMGGSLEEMS